MKEIKEEMESGTVFVTRKTREQIERMAAERSEDEIRQYADAWYNALDRVLKQIAVSVPCEKEFIIYTPERRIGKSLALLRLANDYGAVIVVGSEHEKQRLKRMTGNLGYAVERIISVYDLEMHRMAGIRTVIKTETVKMEDIRNFAGDYYIVGLELI